MKQNVKKGYCYLKIESNIKIIFTYPTKKVFFLIGIHRGWDPRLIILTATYIPEPKLGRMMHRQKKAQTLSFFRV